MGSATLTRPVRALRKAWLLASLLLSGCGTSPPPGGPSRPSEPAVVIREGENRILLRGVVLTPARVLDPGEVLVVGGVITCVAASCASSAGASSATLIDTRGVISPGLIDAHNHIAHNFPPGGPPDPPPLFRNRYEWADDPSYEAHVEPYTKHRSTGTHFCPAAKWGELRSLIHGTTTVQGESFQQACLDWGVRNAEHYHGLGDNHLRTEIGSVRDLTDADARSLVASFDGGPQAATRYAVHMQEGYEGRGVELEFESFAGRDPRPNRHAGLSLLYQDTSILIHAISLTDAQLEEARQSGAKIVWSPSSNFALYGRTAPIERILELGITTGLGPDWTPSGEDELLSEMRFALRFAQENRIAA